MTQAGTSELPAPPAPPLIVTPGMLTQQDLAALRQRGEELSNQLQSVSGRRRSLQESLRRATGADKTGLEQRLGGLDARIARLETDIDENGRLLASLPATRQAIAHTPFSPGSFSGNKFMDNMIPISIVFTIFVLSPIAISVSRLLWRRASSPRPAPPTPESTERLERMEHAIDSIAIEIERVSEGQRFVTRVLAEGRPAGGLAQAGGDFIARPLGEKSGVPR